mgnify:CR=1 FL=1
MVMVMVMGDCVVDDAATGHWRGLCMILDLHRGGSLHLTV